MDPWPEIHRQRLAVAGLLDDLDSAEWSQPSLCAGWTVHDVAAHLTLQMLRLRDVPGMLRHWRGGMQATIAETARLRAAQWAPEQIVDYLRRTAGERRRNVGLTPMEPLIDLLVHGQDIALPLGRIHPVPPEAAAACAQRVLTMRFPPPQPSVRAVAGLRLSATDTAWSFGAGPEVCGPIAALLLAVTGRTALLSRLEGPGARAFGQRLTTM
ncbi:maleylpyruvate isomerase family mycothiol-dependent enzyme [Actinoplanes sp. NPDC051861]|uniref:maleylpyruvate isomerase family mycothiol-dependent enzyme n=1 Tax=Actinoplanes sp. NPDC051861 TaxID=3155170 RepID=UPI003437C46C